MFLDKLVKLDLHRLAHALRASYSTNVSTRALEEWVFSYLQSFMEGLDI